MGIVFYAVLRIRASLSCEIGKKISLLRIRIRFFTLLRVRIPLLFKVMRICVRWSKDPLGSILDPLKLLNFDLNADQRIRIQLPETMSRIRNPGLCQNHCVLWSGRRREAWPPSSTSGRPWARLNACWAVRETVEHRYICRINRLAPLRGSLFQYFSYIHYYKICSL